MKFLMTLNQLPRNMSPCVIDQEFNFCFQTCFVLLQVGGDCCSKVPWTFTPSTKTRTTLPNAAAVDFGHPFLVTREVNKVLVMGGFTTGK